MRLSHYAKQLNSDFQTKAGYKASGLGCRLGKGGRLRIYRLRQGCLPSLYDAVVVKGSGAGCRVRFRVQTFGLRICGRAAS